MADSPPAGLGAFEQVLSERYRFEAEIGRGAMGTVFRAQDLRLGRTVAIKVLHPMLTNELGAARFQSEIRIAATLRHPNIISVHDSGSAEGHLYYVMDYLGGESLRDRLERERQLSIADTIAIATQVADGLQYAHDHGVVHRDVKPENIILVDGGARLVDFGLARALGDTDSERLTASGFSVGTPRYLSPEQASAERHVGPATDQYSLACVVYEMLVGEPPFTGPTAAVIAMRHIAAEHTPIRSQRKSTPPHIDDAIARSLEKVPADRFSTVREFARALNDPESFVSAGGVHTGTMSNAKVAAPTPSRRSRSILAAVGAVVLIGAALAVSRYSGGMPAIPCRLGGACPDTSTFAVLQSGGPATAGDDAASAIGRAMSRWSGVTAIDQSVIRSTIPAQDSVITPDAIGRLARSLHAGRVAVVDGGASAAQDRTIRVRVYDAEARELGQASLRLRAGEALSDRAAADLAYGVLVPEDPAGMFRDDARGTRSLLALRAYVRGRMATHTWALVDAQAALNRALALDPGFAQAALALAQVRSWMTDAPPDAAGLVARASASRDGLSASDRMHASGLAALLAQRPADACVTYDSLIARDSSDIAAWLGRAECGRLDQAVVADPRSPSGFRFRSSRHRVSLALARAFALIPKIDSCCVARADEMQTRVLFIASAGIRVGIGADGAHKPFGAYPELQSDTIAFVPRPIAELNRGVPSTYFAAIRQQREQLLRIAQRRVAEYPGSADALQELGVAMDHLDQPASLDTIEKAFALAKAAPQRLRLGTLRVWLRIKRSAPNDVAGLKTARAIADSILASTTPQSSDDNDRLAGLAMLVGDVHRAARLSSQSTGGPTDPRIPPAAVAASRAFLAYAAFGGPRDSLPALENRTESAILNSVLPDYRSVARGELVGQAALLAFPVYRSPYLAKIDTASALAAAEVALARGDTVGTRKRLAALLRQQSGMRPADFTYDSVYPEGWLLAAVGDSAAALTLVTSALDALPFVETSKFSRPADAGSLLRLMLLRSTLEQSRGNGAAAAAWRRSALTLTDTTKRDAR